MAENNQVSCEVGIKNFSECYLSLIPQKRFELDTWMIWDKWQPFLVKLVSKTILHLYFEGYIDFEFSDEKNSSKLVKSKQEFLIEQKEECDSDHSFLEKSILNIIVKKHNISSSKLIDQLIDFVIPNYFDTNPSKNFVAQIILKQPISWIHLSKKELFFGLLKLINLKFDNSQLEINKQTLTTVNKKLSTLIRQNKKVKSFNETIEFHIDTKLQKRRDNFIE